MSGCQYGWIFDRTSSCKTYGCLNNSEIYVSGYLTASAYASDTVNVWIVSTEGCINYYQVQSGAPYGVRPVIRVYKSSL